MYMLKALVTYIFFLASISAASPTTFTPLLEPRGNFVSAERFRAPEAGPKKPKLTKPSCSSFKYFYCERRCKCTPIGTLKCNEKDAQEMSYIILPSQRLQGMDIDKMIGDPNPPVTAICTAMCSCTVNGVWTWARKTGVKKNSDHSHSGHATTQDNGIVNAGHVIPAPPNSHVIDIGPAGPSTLSNPALSSDNSGAESLSSPNHHQSGHSYPSAPHPEISIAGPSDPSPHDSNSSGAGPSKPSSHHEVRRRGNSQFSGSGSVSSDVRSLGQEVLQGQPSLSSQHQPLSPQRKGRIMCRGSDKLYCQVNCYCAASGGVICNRRSPTDMRLPCFEASKSGTHPGEMTDTMAFEISSRCVPVCRCEIQGFFGLGRAPSVEVTRRLSEEGR